MAFFTLITFDIMKCVIIEDIISAIHYVRQIPGRNAHTSTISASILFNLSQLYGDFFQIVLDFVMKLLPINEMTYDMTSSRL